MSEDADQSRFGGSGASLWDGLYSASLDQSQVALLTEACRIVDRLDKLDALITGDAETWVDIIETRGNPEVAEVVINKPLAEARQQAIALKQILAELRNARAEAVPESGSEEDDELAARRAARLANSAGR